MAHKAESLMERYHSLFVWFVTVRYLIIGFEYLVLYRGSQRFWDFSNVAPQLIGVWMFFVGLIGVMSRIACGKCWTRRARKYTSWFIMGSIAHSLFRLTGFVQNHAILDPLAVLFMCDLAAMIWLKFQLKKWVYCSR